jgi:hypothetical protein
MWGMDPSDSAFIAKDFFIDHQIHDVLIPGVGYGRNTFKICHNKLSKDYRTWYHSNGKTTRGTCQNKNPTLRTQKTGCFAARPD